MAYQILALGQYELKSIYVKNYIFKRFSYFKDLLKDNDDS